MEWLEGRLLLAADALEPNDDFTTAADLGTGDQTHADLSIHESHNDDWYRWTASAGGQLTADVLFSHAAGDLDVNLYSSTRELLRSSASNDNNEQVQYQVTADQVYYIQVFGFFGAVQEDYTLAIDGPQPMADALEPNDSFAAAANLATGDRTVSGLTIDQAGDDDWYVWRAPATGPLAVTAQFLHARGNLDLEVYGANENLILASTSETDNESVSFAAATGQAYYVRIFGAGGAIQRDYQLIVNGPDIPPDAFEPNDTLLTAHDLQTEDQSHAGLTIHAVGNDDWYKWRRRPKAP